MGAGIVSLVLPNTESSYVTLKERVMAQDKRMYWLDNLRTCIILLVTLYHVGGVYEAAGLWAKFWIVDDPNIITWVGIVGIVFDIFIMPIMFFISGYLTPASLDRKGSWSFLKGKAQRLLLPWLIAVLTLIPLYNIIFLFSRGLPWEHWSNYLHFTNPRSQSWLWFLPVLFVFNVIYLLITRARIRLTNLSMTQALFITTVVGFAYSFAIGGILGFRSWTLTPVLDFENERLLLYFLAFLLGVLAFRRNVFAEKPRKKALLNVVNAIAWIPVAGHIIIRIWPFIFPEGFEITPMYRCWWWLSFYTALAAMAYAMIETFRRFVDRSGRIWNELNRNSFGVYILHTILIGLFGTMLLKVDLPGVAKYPILFVATYLGSNLIVSIYRRVIRRAASITG